MTTLLAFVFAIALLVVFHELGHYWVARLYGVKVLRFSVGFGKAIYTKRFANSETDWVISAIPLGGYVKMLDEREGKVLPQELAQAFNRKPVLQRMAIVLAGPAANFLLAILLYWTMFMYGVPGLKPVLGEVIAQSPAAMAQMQEQELITHINGEDVSSWDEVRWKLLNLILQGEEAHVETIAEQGDIRQHHLDLQTLAPTDLDGDFLRKIGLQPFKPLVRPVLGNLTDGGVAQQSGLRAGDHILRVNGRSIAHWMEFVALVRGHPGQEMRLEVGRAGSVLPITIKPEVASDADLTIGKIGAAPEIDRREFEAMMTKVRYEPFAAFSKALLNTWEMSVVSLKMLGKMVLGEISLKNLSGPVTIADYAGQSAQMGLAAYLGFLALISVSLGVLNLLPIPLLDGGHLLYYAVELAKGSPVSERIWLAGQNIGIAILFTLMALALYNDMIRLFLD